MAFLISPNLPANVVEIGNEITQAKIDEINGGVLATQDWVSGQGYSTTSGITDAPNDGTQYVRQNLGWYAVSASGVTADKATANAIAASLWYVYDTGTDYNKTGGPVNVQLLAGYNNSGVTDGTTFVTGFPSVITSLSPSQYWWVSVNGTLSDFIVSDAAP